MSQHQNASTKSTAQRFMPLLKKIWSGLQWFLLLIAVGLGLVWNIPPFKAYCTQKGWLTSDGAPGVMAALVAVTFFIMKEVAAKSETIVKELQELKITRDVDIIEGGADSIFSVIDPELREHKSIRKIIEIDVLGFTLFSIHMRLDAWKRAGVLRSMVLNLYCLDEAFIKATPQLPDAWSVHVTQFTEQIEWFVSTNQTYLKENNVTIKVIRFKHLPAVHGFRIGNGTLCISIATWHNGVIESPMTSTYERVRAIDSSQHAGTLRSLFDSWVEAAGNYSDAKKSSIIAIVPVHASNSSTG